MLRPTAIIAEDEGVLREALREQIARLWPELEICGLATDGIEALALFQRHRPAIVFLDVEMPGLSGLEVARHLSGRCHLVFVTAFDSHAVAAFDQGAIDYILKPFSPERLMTALSRVRERLAQPLAPIDTLLRDLAAARRAPRHLRWIKALSGNAVELVLVDEVCYFEAAAKYTGVFTPTAECLIRTPIKTLAIELDPDRFWQISRSAIVRVEAILRIVRGFDGSMQLLLKTRPERLSVSETFRPLFRHM